MQQAKDIQPPPAVEKPPHPSAAERDPRTLADFFDTFPLLPVIEQAPLAIIITDDQARIQYINPQAEATFGYALHELQGTLIEVLIPEKFHASHPKARQQFTAQPHKRLMGIGLDLLARKKTGEVFPVEVGLSHVRVDDQLYIVSYVSDITQRKEIEKQLVISEARFRNLIEAAPDAVILINQAGSILQLNSTGEQNFGYKEHELVGSPVKMLMPDIDLDISSDHQAQSASAPDTHPMGIDQEIEALRKDGSSFPVEIALSPILMEGEQMVIAIVRDISERKMMERERALLAQIVQQMKDAVILTDSDDESRVRYVNKAFTDLYGYSEDEILDKSSWILFGGDEQARQAIAQKREQTIEKEDEYRGIYQDRKKDGSLFWVSNTSSIIQLNPGEPPYDLGIVRDVSQRVQYQQLLNKKNAFLSALHETSLDILSHLDLDRVLESLISKASKILDCEHGLVYLLKPGEQELTCLIGIGSFRQLVGSTLKPGQGFIGSIWQSGRAQICRSPHDEMNCPGYTVPQTVGSAIGVPLLAGDKIIGVLCMADGHHSENEFGADEVEMLGYFAQLASIAIQNARLFSETQRALQLTQVQKARMDRELEIARSVQRALLPHELPQLPHWSFAAMWEPALEVAGDYYDLILREDGYFDLIIADVTDKGAPAALFMAYSKSVLNLCLNSASSLLEGVVLANQFLVQKNVGPFVTVFVARLHISSGEMVYVNAGHPPALLYQSDSEQILELSNTGMPLGIDTDQVYQQRSVQLEKDDFLVLYTDGIIEATDQDKAMFGTQRLKEVLYQHRQEVITDLSRRLIGEVASFRSNANPQDDIAILAAKRS